MSVCRRVLWAAAAACAWPCTAGRRMTAADLAEDELTPNCEKTSSESNWRGWKFIRCETCETDSAMLNGPPPGLSRADLKARSIEVVNHCAKFDKNTEGKRIVLIRHGESIWNKVTAEYGFAAQAVGMTSEFVDSPLSTDGLRMAQRLALLLAEADPGAAPAPTGGDPPARRLAFGAVEELGYTNLSDLVQIVKGKHPVSDNDLLAGLRHHREELEVLVGRKCGDTRFITSQLTRAIDTFNIVMLRAALNCDKSFEVSSNLQEFEHNADCTPRANPGDQPTVDPKQAEQYIESQMARTLSFVEERYKSCDTERFTSNLGPLQRQRLLGSNPVFKERIGSEFDSIMGSSEHYAVMGGHSIWFRELFKLFGDQGSSTCKELGSDKVKIANVGVAAMTLRKVEDKDTPYAAVDCTWIHLGWHKVYKYNFDQEVFTKVVPEAKDFGRLSPGGTHTIAGWKCCCPEAWTSPFGCVRVRSHTNSHFSCGNTGAWEVVAGKDQDFIQEAAKYRWAKAFGFDQQGKPNCVEAVL